MNGKPNGIVIRDGKQRKDGLGRELAWAQRLFGCLRSAGAVQGDLAQLGEKANSEDYELILAVMRGMIKPKDIIGNIINLDSDPGFPSHERGWLKLIVDNRLGMHVVDFRGSGPEYFGGNSVFIGGNRLLCGGLSGKSPVQKEGVFDKNPAFLHHHDVHLNKRGAEWITYARPEIAKSFLDPRPGAVIFSFGTVWRQLEHQHTAEEAMSPVSAAAIWDDGGHIRCERRSIPIGEWPENHYALLFDPTQPN